MDSSTINFFSRLCENCSAVEIQVDSLEFVVENVNPPAPMCLLNGSSVVFTCNIQGSEIIFRRPARINPGEEGFTRVTQLDSDRVG